MRRQTAQGLGTRVLSQIVTSIPNQRVWLLWVCVTSSDRAAWATPLRRPLRWVPVSAPWCQFVLNFSLASLPHWTASWGLRVGGGGRICVLFTNVHTPTIHYPTWPTAVSSRVTLKIP